MADVFPNAISKEIWDMKYRFKDAHGNPIDETVEDTWKRIANALAEPERGADSSEVYYSQFYDALSGFKFLPAGRITAGAGTGRAVTLFNCFVMGTIPDSMDGIFSMLREAALTMQQGGGIGYDFSPIRPKSSLVKKLGADASGPISFMNVWDAMCRTVMSAGSRRGAMMATMRCDHPDIRDFISAKRDASALRMFNLSVLVTDDFMAAVKRDGEWPLVHTEPPKGTEAPEELDPDDGREGPLYVHEVVRARDLWNEIIKTTYDVAEPGVIFIDRINETNNLRAVETIAATNPCGEQPLPPYGACLLGSINLAALVLDPFKPTARMDYGELDRLVKTAVRAMDNVIDISNFPLLQQHEEARAKRRIGLGVTGLADALAMCRWEYGTGAAAKEAKSWMKQIDVAAYQASIELAKEKGAYPRFDAEQVLARGTHASTLPLHLRAKIRKYGLRNALLTSIAPTGTISLYAGNVSSGIEPIFAHSYTRKVLQPDGTKTEERVEDFAVSKYREFWESEQGETFDPEIHLPNYFVTTADLTPEAHLRMQAACQRWVDSSISKTINVPEDIPFDEFKQVYESAYDMGCKGCTTYRPNDVTGSVLSTDKKEEVAVKAELTEPGADTSEEFQARVREMAGTPGGPIPNNLTLSAQPHQGDPAYTLAALPERPEELRGATYKIKVGDQKAVYLTINDMIESDGTVRPFEIFLRSSDPVHDEWMVALARMISAIMRRPHDASFVGPELMRVTSAVSGGFQKGQGFQPSLVAAIGRQIKDHTERTKRTMASELKRIMTENPDWAAKVTGVAWPEDSAQANDDLDGDHIPETFSPVRPQMCPMCSSTNVRFQSGCPTCADCGYSKCG